MTLAKFKFFIVLCTKFPSQTYTKNDEQLLSKSLAIPEIDH